MVRLPLQERDILKPQKSHRVTNVAQVSVIKTFLLGNPKRIIAVIFVGLKSILNKNIVTYHLVSFH